MHNGEDRERGFYSTGCSKQVTYRSLHSTTPDMRQHPGKVRMATSWLHNIMLIPWSTTQTHFASDHLQQGRLVRSRWAVVDYAALERVPNTVAMPLASTTSPSGVDVACAFT